MKFDVLFFEGEFVIAKASGWQWGPGETDDPRFELARDVNFPLIGSEKTVNGVLLRRNEFDEIEAI